MAIKFYLEINGRRYMLPVNPGAVLVDVPGRNESNEVVKLGEITHLASKGLKAVTFDCFFPASENHSMILNGSSFLPPNDYCALIEKAMDDQKPIRLIITDSKINMLTSIESFNWSIVDSTGDFEYSITLKEYREYAAKFVKTVTKQVSQQPARPVVSQEITIGSTVIVNGRLHRDSFGSGPGQTEVNATRKVNFIQRGRSHPYHVTLINGGWRGWVTAGSVRRI
ncbi:hypothetical protein ACQUEU_04065 [Enterococcus casseliflavus]|uniref:hypothetical protein n=1 Tax=Enterococcus casseliflavus TaxID=37734 RepID=UPI001BCAB6D4|nr:hypothetical protein [Enterococcus casseliflavus]